MTAPAPSRRSPGELAHRLYGGVSRAGLSAAFGLVACFSLGRSLATLFDEIRASGLAAWLLDALLEFAGHAAVAVVLVALIAPVMNLAPRRGWRRAAALLPATVAALCVASVVRVVVLYLFMPPDAPPMGWLQWLDRFFVRFFVRYAYLATLFLLLVELQRHVTQSLREMRRAELDRLALDREMAAAHLQVLQAQIEPHFLFNTLAHVRRLYQTDAAAGRQMLDNLMRYLEVALPHMRDETSTLERERALIDAFLRVQKVRMGRRLHFEIDIPPALEAMQVPPMMLLTLVENALKHGLGPLPEGGMVRLQARLEHGELVLEVADSGRGLGDSSAGGGTGIANIRNRLHAMFGDRAALELTSHLPRGVTATLRLPAAAQPA